MIGKTNGIPFVYLLSEDMYFTDGPALVATVLGSCVSVTMFSRRREAAAICHALLPYCRWRRRCPVNCPEKYRYVDCAVAEMAEEFRLRNVKPREIEVNVFGGARIAGSVAGKNDSVGGLNAEAAFTAIQSKRMVIKKADIGGDFGRKIYFYTHTGNVFLKRLER